MKKAIVLEISKPKTAKQRKLWGETRFEDHSITTIWMAEGQENKRLVDTFFHEMTHLFLNLAHNGKKISLDEEEALCRMVGQTASAILTKGAHK